MVRRGAWLVVLAAAGCVQSTSLGNELAASGADGEGDGDAGAYATTDSGWPDVDQPGSETGDSGWEPEPDPDADGEDDGEDDGESTGGDPVTLPSSWDPPEGCTGETGDGLRCLPTAVVDCATSHGYATSWWRADDPDADPERLWVAGVYETRNDHSASSHPTGEGRVSWSIAGQNILVLSAYEPTDWTVTLEGDGQLSRIIATGYYEQSVDGPPGVTVETFALFDGSSTYACGYSVPGNGGGCEGKELVAFAQQVTGLQVAGFDGCYRATEFNFGW